MQFLSKQGYTNYYLHKRVVLTSTNFNGEKGVVEDIYYPLDNPAAIYGLEVRIKLDSGVVVTAYKSEDFSRID